MRQNPRLPSAQHARTRLVNLTHTWGFLTSSQMGRKGRLDVFSLCLWPRALSLSLSIPFHSVRNSYVDVKLFALNCVHVWKGWPRIDLVMRPFWQYFEYIYFSTFNIYILVYMQTINDHAICLTVFKQYMYEHYISEVISVSFVVPLGGHLYFYTHFI